MWQVVDKVVYGMASLRFISGMIELTGGLLMLYFGTAQRALQVNGLLALVGPVVLIGVTAFGVIGIADEVKIWRIVMLLIGVGCILFASRS
ncbi:YqhV family protein [Alicyclobacillus fastidiosus]|uniref:YqhV family protein n=1 Tax=Alicyclobacillus fastidiosus TaxID=392011 RepID=A0ABV5AFV2_9BACL|nr:YqhV family protein [Alicyclobacillus fastidiosus]WEH11706.1 YqhV family protein [Alicyclobacillus fastidiosus]